MILGRVEGLRLKSLEGVKDTHLTFVSFKGVYFEQFLRRGDQMTARIVLLE